MNPASVQQVRYTQELPATSAMDNFASFVNAGAQGYFARKQKAKDDFAKLMPYLIQMKMASAAPKGTPGAVEHAGMPWNISQPAPDYGDMNTMLSIKQKEQELKDYRPPEELAAFKAAMESFKTQQGFSAKPMTFEQMMALVKSKYPKGNGQAASQFIEGQLYRDKDGNVAKYSNGEWITQE